MPTFVCKYKGGVLTYMRGYVPDCTAQTTNHVNGEQFSYTN